MPRTQLQVGAPAPPFRAMSDDSDEPISLEQLYGRPVVLYFYPMDNTPGCTAQACAFRDAYAPLQEEGAYLLGVSMDSLDRHRKFRAKHNLPFPLLSDPKGEIVDAYGAWQRWGFYRTGLMVNRMTVLIDAQGRVARVWRSADPKGNVAEVLAALRELRDTSVGDGEAAANE